MEKQKSKTVTLILNVPVSKKGSVRFSAKKAEDGGPKAPITRDVYVDRLAAMQQLGINDLDTVKAIELTIRAVE